MDNRTFEIEIEEKEGRLHVRMNGKPVCVDFERLADGNDYSMLLDTISYHMNIEKEMGTYQVQLNGHAYPVLVQSEKEILLGPVSTEKTSQTGVEEVKAPMPGLIVEVEVGEGDAVTKGSGLIIVEAMKMENELKSPVAGVVQEVRVQKGETVEQEQVLVIIG